MFREQRRGGEGSLCVLSTMFSNVFNLRLVEFMDSELTATKGECTFLHKALTGLQFSTDGYLEGFSPMIRRCLLLFCCWLCLMVENHGVSQHLAWYHTREKSRSSSMVVSKSTSLNQTWSIYQAWSVQFVPLWPSLFAQPDPPSPTASWCLSVLGCNTR